MRLLLVSSLIAIFRKDSKRIVSVADIFDVLSSKRHYKPAFPLEECIRIINEMSGKNLDPELVRTFNENIEEFKKIREKMGEE